MEGGIMPNLTRVRLFLASPSDLGEERDRVSRVVEEINRGIAETLGFTVEVVRWETHVSPAMGRPQETILNQLELTNSDIFVGMLWLRFGSATGGMNTATGREFRSGTEEEFSVAYQSWKASQKPRIMFYHCVRTPGDMSQIDPTQLARVREFMKRFKPEGDHPGLFYEFKDAAEFERHFREDLTYALNEIAPEGDASLPKKFKVQGFERLILPGAKEERGRVKCASLEEANDIRLVAHSGYSFLALMGHLYRDVVERRLSGGAKFRIVLSNPWSLAGLFLALAEKEGDARPLFDHSGALVVDPVKIIEESAWYSIKLKDSMTGYDRLKQRYGEAIEARLCSAEISSTILLTDTTCYLEPYLNVNLQERHQKDMITFEVEADSKCHLYRHASGYFDTYWRLGLPLSTFKTTADRLKDQFQAVLRASAPFWNTDP
jgi:hypothetical protein